ncbi:hypothetical protein EK21DRAFT_88108 [Setomelanomma holmii]|uniref:Protein kinase domain-containing protein n=1 Tax=Setomelanomma holmii TaxID=210430 RepID=A0A9P4LNM2_9PLEO|nr:hypothetical protein EK21DRAFT_88108 [Setomelanomma holmii]
MSGHSQEGKDTLTEYKELLDTQWTRPVACQNQCDPPDSCSCQRLIVHVDAMKQWWLRKLSEASEQTKLQKLLDEMPLFSHRMFPLKYQELLNGKHSCLIVFSLLLKQERGHLIDCFYKSAMNDNYLAIERTQTAEQTLRDNLRDTEHVHETNTILDDFEKQKWAFCSLELTLGMSRSLHGTKVIPPFCHKVKMGDKGGTASIYWVAVQQEFISDPDLRAAIKDSLYTDPVYDECYQMVLKSYCGNKKAVYDLEKEAFSGLSSNDNVPIVRYLGCYTHDYGEGSKLGKTYNLLLECGERDLYQAWADETNVPPVQAEEIIRFWRSLFDVAEAIRHVHNLEVPRHGKGAPLRYIGWHADIKPDNILIVRGHLKLADFGYSRFAPVARTSNGSVPTELINGFTDTYGAPEVSRMKQPDGTMSGVTQSIDTWSFGCVLSVAATWVVLGFQGVRQFEQLRQLSPSNRGDEVTYDRFHDGFQVLPEIRKWHKYLRGHVRCSDTATVRVLDLIENNMLQKDPSDRFELEELCDRLTENLDWATERVNNLKIHSREIDAAVVQALLNIEEQAHKNASELKNTPLNHPTAQNQVSKAMNPLQRATMQVRKSQMIKDKPLGQTPYRREILKKGLEANKIISENDEKPLAAPINAHNGGFTNSPTNGHAPTDTFSVARRPKPRNPDRVPSPGPGEASKAREQFPVSIPPTPSFKRDRQQVEIPAIGLAEMTSVQTPTGPAAIASAVDMVLPEKVNQNRTYQPPTPDTGPSHPNHSSPTNMSKRPSLSLQTPIALPRTTGEQRDGSVGSPQSPSKPQPVISNSPPQPQLATPTTTSQTPRSNGYSPFNMSRPYDSDGPQWQSAGYWQNGGIDAHVAPNVVSPRGDHVGLSEAASASPLITLSPPVELTTTNTPPRPPPSQDHSTEKQSVITDETHHEQESLPFSVFELPYDVCNVRRDVDQEGPKGKRAKLKGILRLEERKADKGLTKVYGDGREIVFVVDNGVSMFEHWPIVVFVAETLAKRAAGLDGNGVDLMFTVDGHGHNKCSLKGEAGRRSFRTALDSAAPEYSGNRDLQTDMHMTLDAIVRNWRVQGKKATTLLILTDGVWAKTMENLVDNLILGLAEEATRSTNVGKRPFSIQFIRFGEACAGKLSMYDNELCSKRHLRDIVDHCSWRSTVEKMFKGSIDPQDDQYDPLEIPITYNYQDLVALFRNFNDNQDGGSSDNLLSPRSRSSLSRTPSSRSAKSDAGKRNTMPPTNRSESWKSHSRNTFSH